MAATTSMRCFSDSELSDLDTITAYSCERCCYSDIPMTPTRRDAKHDIFADAESQEVLELFIRHSKQLAKRRHQTMPSGGVLYSRSLESPVDGDTPVFSMKDIWADDMVDGCFNPLDSPRLRTRRNAVWRLNSSCAMEVQGHQQNGGDGANDCDNKNCAAHSLTRTKKVYNNLAAMA